MNRRDVFKSVLAMVAGLFGWSRVQAGPVKKETPPPRQPLYYAAEPPVKKEGNWQPISCQVNISSYLDGKGRNVRLVTGDIYYAKDDAILAYGWIEKLRSPARLPGSTGVYRGGVVSGRLGLIEFELHDICG